MNPNTNTSRNPPETPRAPAQVAQDLGTDLAKGLGAAEVKARQAKDGPNALAEEHTTAWQRIAQFFWGPIPWMIEAAAVLSLVLGDWSDFGIILTMLLVNAGVGWWQESKADDAIQALKQRLAPSARVLRDGTWATVPAVELVRAPMAVTMAVISPSLTIEPA